MRKKLFAGILSSLLLIQSFNLVSAEDIFTSAEEKLSGIDNLIVSCEEKGLSCDMQRAEAEIIRQFIEYGRYDLTHGKTERAQYMLSEILSSADETKTELENIFALESGVSVPKYNGGKITADGMNFKTPDNADNFFGGYLIFGDEQDKLPLFEKMGNNLYAWEIGPRSTIVEEGTFLPSWQATVKDDITIEADNTVSYDGGTSVKFVCNRAMTSGYYAELKQTLLVKPRKTYQVDFWLKGNEARGNIVYLNDEQDRKTLPTGTYDWQKVSYEVTTGGEQTSLVLKFIAQNTTKGLWVDNISVKEKGRDYNYIDNGSFETEWQENEFLVNRGAVNYIKAVMEEAKENNIAAMILLSPHYIPDWFWTNYPESYGYQEGFLKGNVANDTYKKFIKTHVQAVAQAAGEFSNLHSLILTNEPIYSTIYYTNGSQIFKDDFIDYLRRKYNSLDGVYVPQQMRKNWGITNPLYKWSDVSMPAANTISSNGKFWDWMEYNNEVFTGFHKWLADTVHEVDSSIPVHAKIYDITFKRSKLDKGIDAEEIYSYLDYNGFDGGMNYSSDREGYLHIRMAEDLANSISETPTVNSENHIIPDDCDDYSYKHGLIAGADLWQGFLHGRTAAAAWLWRRHDTWAEFRNSIAYRPDMVENISEKTMNANRFSKELVRLQNSDRNFYILYSNAALLYNEEVYMSACNNAYEALWSMGQRASFITEKQIAAGKLDNNDVLIIPSTANIDECALDNLNTFGGKTLVMGSMPTKNEYNIDISLLLKDKTEVSNDLSSIQAAYEAVLNEKNIPVVTIRDKDGNYIGMTDIRATVDRDSILINACNNTWENKENLSVYYGERKLDDGFDLISNEETENNFTLTPFEPMLLKFDFVPTTSSDIAAWARVDSKNTDKTLYDTVNLIEDESCGAVVEVIKQSEKISDSRLGIRQTISASKLVEGHTYVLEFKYKMENLPNKYWLQAGFSSWDGKYLTQPCDDEVGDAGWRSGSKSVTYSSSAFSSGLPVWIFTSNAQAHFWIADVTVYDAADENKTNLIENGSFDKSIDDYEMSADELSMPGWIIGDYASTTVKRVFEPLSGGWRAKLTNNGTGKSPYILKYTVPKDKLTEGHTYKVSLYVKTENLANGGYIYFGAGDKKLGNTYVPNWKSGGTAMLTGVDLYSNNIVSFGHDSSMTEIVYADNLVIIDETTGETLVLENPDFETALDSKIDFTQNNGKCTASVISKKQAYTILMAYALYNDERLMSVEKNKYDVEAKPDVQEFNMNIEIPSDGYIGRAFLWDAETLKPLAKAIDVH